MTAQGPLCALSPRTRREKTGASPEAVAWVRVSPRQRCATPQPSGHPIGSPAMSASYRVGTRASPLALAQTEEVVSRLRDRFPNATFEIVPMTTGGDRRKEAALVSLGRGAFAKEIESALLAGDIDLAVHSAKDLASELPAGLVIAGTVPRQDPRDALVDKWTAPLSKLPQGARIGTGSPRRTALLKSLRKDIEVVPVRGNVGTRIGKVGGPECDAVVVAAAGLARLGRIDEAHELFPAGTFVPDAGQGTLAVQARTGDQALLEMVRAIDHGPTSAALEAERAFVRRIGGSCRVPVAALASLSNGGELRIHGIVAAPDGSQVFRREVSTPGVSPAELGETLASLLISDSAELLES